LLIAVLQSFKVTVKRKFLIMAIVALIC
jgi:hypothetical protein